MNSHSKYIFIDILPNLSPVTQRIIYQFTTISTLILIFELASRLYTATGETIDVYDVYAIVQNVLILIFSHFNIFSKSLDFVDIMGLSN